MESPTFVPVPGASLRYRETGSRTPIVLLHGWALDSRVWDPLARELQPDFRVIRYDRRGFGESSGVPSLVDEVADLSEVLARAKAGPVILVGMSQATRIVVAAAAAAAGAAAPGDIRGIVLDGAPPDLAVPGAGSDIDFESLRERAVQGGVEAFREAWGRHPCLRLYGAGNAERALLRDIVAVTPAADLRDIAGPPRGLPNSLEALRQITAPVLLLNGEHDSPQRQRSARAIAGALKAPHAHLSLPGAGHLAALDRPRAYANAIRNFLDSIHAR